MFLEFFFPPRNRPSDQLSFGLIDPSRVGLAQWLAANFSGAQTSWDDWLENPLR